MFNKRTLILLGLGLLGGILGGWSLFLSTMREGAGHRHFVMPEQALHAPGYFYPLTWLLVLPLSMVRNKIVRWTTGSLVVGQTVSAMVLLLNPSGMADLDRAFSHGRSVSFGILQIIAIYVIVNVFSMVAAFIPRGSISKRPKFPAVE